MLKIPLQWSDFDKNFQLLIVTLAAIVPDFSSGIGESVRVSFDLVHGLRKVLPVEDRRIGFPRLRGIDE